MKSHNNYFIYKRNPFRPLYLGGLFNLPNKRNRLWLFTDRDLARKLSALNGAEYANFRDYIRLATGGKVPPTPPAQRGKGRDRHPPTLDELA